MPSETPFLIVSNDVPLALQPLLTEAIPVKLYRDPIGHVCNTHARVLARTALTLFLESLREYSKKKTVKSLTRMLFPEKILRGLLVVCLETRLM